MTHHLYFFQAVVLHTASVLLQCQLQVQYVHQRIQM